MQFLWPFLEYLNFKKDGFETTYQPIFIKNYMIMFYNFSIFLYSRFSKKPSMSLNIRLCTHKCAKCWLKKLRILIPLIAMPAPSSGCCSTSVAWSSRTAFRSPNSMKSTPGEISRLNHRWRCSRLKILRIRILLIFLRQ